MDATVTGPVRSWAATITGTPRRQALPLDYQVVLGPVADFPYGAMGSDFATIHAPYTLRSQTAPRVRRGGPRRLGARRR